MFTIRFMTQFLPALNWPEETSLHPSFASVLKFVGKLFRKFQSGDPPVGDIRIVILLVFLIRGQKLGRCLLYGWMALQVV